MFSLLCVHIRTRCNNIVLLFMRVDNGASLKLSQFFLLSLYFFVFIPTKWILKTFRWKRNILGRDWTHSPIEINENDLLLLFLITSDLWPGFITPKVHLIYIMEEVKYSLGPWIVRCTFLAVTPHLGSKLLQGLVQMIASWLYTVDLIFNEIPWIKRVMVTSIICHVTASVCHIEIFFFNLQES